MNPICEKEEKAKKCFYKSRILKNYNLKWFYTPYWMELSKWVLWKTFVVGDAHGNSKQGPNIVTAGWKMIIF